jgi:hypothetical protein
VVLIGRDAPHRAPRWRDTGVPLLDATDMPDAVAWRRRAPTAGDAVLLSPGLRQPGHVPQLRPPRRGVPRRRARSGADAAGTDLEVLA